VTSAHRPLTRRAGDLVVGEDATEITIAEIRQSRLHVVDGDEIDANGQPWQVSAWPLDCLALVRIAHSAALSA
jgi:hypothetical protein